MTTTSEVRIKKYENSRLIKEENEKANKDLQKIQKRFNEAAKKIRAEGENRLDSERVKQSVRLARQADISRDRLTELQNRTNTVRKKVETETTDFKKNQDALRYSYQIDNEQKIAQNEERFKEQLSDINENFSKTNERLNFETTTNLKRMKEQFDEQLQTQETKNLGELRNSQTDFRKKFTSQRDKFDKELINQSIQGAKRIEDVKREYQTKNDQIKTLNEDKIKKNRAFYKQTLLEMDKTFKAQFQKMNAEHQAFLKNQKESHEKEIAAIKNAQSKKKTFFVERATDPFYKSTTLTPIINEKEKGYEIKVKVPAHEMGMVRLTGDDREIILSSSRRFEERVTDESGSVSESKKYETMNRTFKVNDIIDESTIKQSYKDGVLTFTIAKK